MKRVMRAIGLTLALLGVGVAGADALPDLYSAEVAVADQSSAELTRASRAAMSEVLVKVSGSADVLANPSIKAALGDARKHVQRISYSGRAGSEQGLAVQLQFDRAYITGLVIDAGAPIWTANRPAVLVWLVTESDAGRQFVNAETSPERVAALREAFSRRGIPVQMPLYDLTDAAALDPDRAWNLDPAALLEASARYNLEDVLAGRFSLLSTGAVVGEWDYLHGDERKLRNANVATEAQFLQEGVALTAEAMAGRYAVAATAGDGDLIVSVSGITDYADYAAVVTWLESLELVEQAAVQTVQGDTIRLRLKAQADPVQLAKLIEINKRLVPVPLGMPGPGSAGLNYQWQ